MSLSVEQEDRVKQLLRNLCGSRAGPRRLACCSLADMVTEHGMSVVHVIRSCDDPNRDVYPHLHRVTAMLASATPKTQCAALLFLSRMCAHCMKDEAFLSYCERLVLPLVTIVDINLTILDATRGHAVRCLAHMASVRGLRQRMLQADIVSHCLPFIEEPPSATTLHEVVTLLGLLAARESHVLDVLYRDGIVRTLCAHVANIESSEHDGTLIACLGLLWLLVLQSVDRKSDGGALPPHDALVSALRAIGPRKKAPALLHRQMAGILQCLSACDAQHTVWADLIPFLLDMVAVTRDHDSRRIVLHCVYNVLEGSPSELCDAFVQHEGVELMLGLMMRPFYVSAAAMVLGQILQTDFRRQKYVGNCGGLTIIGEALVTCPETMLQRRSILASVAWMAIVGNRTNTASLVAAHHRVPHVLAQRLADPASYVESVSILGVMCSLVKVKSIRRRYRKVPCEHVVATMLNHSDDDAIVMRSAQVLTWLTSMDAVKLFVKRNGVTVLAPWLRQPGSGPGSHVWAMLRTMVPLAGGSIEEALLGQDLAPTLWEAVWSKHRSTKRNALPFVLWLCDSDTTAQQVVDAGVVGALERACEPPMTNFLVRSVLHCVLSLCNVLPACTPSVVSSGIPSFVSAALASPKTKEDCKMAAAQVAHKLSRSHVNHAELVKAGLIQDSVTALRDHLPRPDRHDIGGILVQCLAEFGKSGVCQMAAKQVQQACAQEPMQSRLQPYALRRDNVGAAASTLLS